MGTAINIQTEAGPTVAVRRLEGPYYPPTRPYLVGNLSFGVQHRLQGMGTPRLMRGSGPGVEIGYKLIAGNRHNQNSQSHQFEIKGTWKQYFGEHLFITAKGGVNFGGNRLNFGTGIKPDFSSGIETNAELFVGGELTLKDRLRLFLLGGYEFQVSLMGEPKFLEHGPMFGLGLSIDVGRS